MNLFKRPQKNLPARRQLGRQVTVELEDSATFRRGRTLTGSASSAVHTTNESQADLKSSRVQTHELHKKRRRISGALFAVLFVAAGFYLLISQFTAHATVQASPDPTVQLEPVYAETIDSYLGDNLSQRWRFLTDTDRVTRYLQASTPEVESVKLRGSSGFGKSLFEITFRKPIASWGVNYKDLFVDASGVPFARNYFSPPTLRITDKSGMISTTSGQSVMSNRFMSYVGQVIGHSETQGLAVSTIEIPEGMTRQIEVRLEGVEYPFKFSSDREAGESVDDMVKVIKWMRDRNLTPEYADVRVGGRVFYKE